MDKVMKTRNKHIFLIGIIGVFVLASLAVPAKAQENLSTPTPALVFTQAPLSGVSVATPTPTPVPMQLSDPNTVTFDQIVQYEIQLNGPYDSTSFSFTLPADWALSAGAQLNLSMGVSFKMGGRAAAGGQGEQSDVILDGGTLTILVNDVVAKVLILNEVGEVNKTIDIPVQAFESERGDKRSEIRFILDSGSSCRTSDIKTVVFIHTESYFVLPHTFVQPSTKLANFPQPIFQDSFLPDTALLVIPDQPSALELQAALTTAAGLGKLSGNRLLLDMTTLSKFKSEDAQKNHLIFVGKAASLPVLNGLEFPLPAANNQFPLSGDTVDDGIVEMIDSPWSNGPHVILAVSGNTDLGTIKAAQAVSTGVFLPSSFPNLAVIKEINSSPITTPQTIDQTLTDLGYDGVSFSSRGSGGTTYDFDVPPGMTLGPDAYFELVFGHSALLDYTTSQIVVLLNNKPIGSVRMSDETAALPTNKIRFNIPELAVVPGNNRLRVTVYISPLSDCTPPDAKGLWINIWPDSNLHLPLVSAGTSVKPETPQDLGAYPAPFTFNSVLADTAFVFARNDLESWRKAVQIASYFGSSTNGPIVALSAFYGDEMPVADRSKYNLLVVGRPTQIPILYEMNDYLPAPFLAGSDTASEGGFQVTYRIPPDSSMGYIETMLSPWNPEKVVLAILGNTTQGINWAAAALIDPTLRFRLGGNFAVVNDRQIINTNTRYTGVTTGSILPTEFPNGAVDVTGAGSSQGQTSRPGWILPVLAVLVGLIIAVVIVVAIRARLRNRVLAASLNGKQDMENNNEAGQE